MLLKLLKICSLLLIVLVIPAVLIHYLDFDLYRYLVQEDGPAEYITALALLLCSLIFVIRFIKFRGKKGRAWQIGTVLMAFVFFFGFGEEISWGQRIFDTQSAQFFVEHNRQKEMNLHNLEINGVNLNRVIFSWGITLVMGFYFLFSKILYHRMKDFRVWVKRLQIPLPHNWQTILFLSLSALILILPDSKKWELWEYLFGLTLLIIFLDPYPGSFFRSTKKGREVARPS